LHASLGQIYFSARAASKPILQVICCLAILDAHCSRHAVAILAAVVGKLFPCQLPALMIVTEDWTVLSKPLHLRIEEFILKLLQWQWLLLLVVVLVVVLLLLVVLFCFVSLVAKDR
jgi:ABC-type Na+ efflux pump permease subunit